MSIFSPLPPLISRVIIIVFWLRVLQSPSRCPWHSGGKGGPASWSQAVNQQREVENRAMQAAHAAAEREAGKLGGTTAPPPPPPAASHSRRGSDAPKPRPWQAPACLPKIKVGRACRAEPSVAYHSPPLHADCAQVHTHKKDIKALRELCLIQVLLTHKGPVWTGLPSPLRSHGHLAVHCACADCATLLLPSHPLRYSSQIQHGRSLLGHRRA